ncbi:hypothetical protein ACOSP7_014956 [Xanthoceras sorbifolium]
MPLSKFSQIDSCDLLKCDESHRLKNDHTLTKSALSCKCRILLSGTYALLSNYFPQKVSHVAWFMCHNIFL